MITTINYTTLSCRLGFPDSSVGKESPAMQETPVRFLGWEDPLEKGQATHSSILAWRIPWTVQSQGITKNLTNLSDFQFHKGFPGGLLVKNLPANAGESKRHGFDPWVGKIPQRRKWQPTPVFLPGKSYGQRSLVGYSPQGHKELETADQLNMHTWHQKMLQFHSFTFQFSSFTYS